MNNQNFDKDPETQEFHIDDHDRHTNLEGRHKRGVILYIKSHLNATISHIAGENKFQESLWCELKLKGADNLLIGVDCSLQITQLQQEQP
jgi:hypothetical protein